MAAGQVNRNKGTDHLIEGASRARDAGFEDFVIDVYGNADDPYFHALARYREVEGHVRFLGSRPQSELARLYLDYDVFAFPTWHREPFAFAPLEASWRGCVPLMSQRCGNAEWFVHGVHCLKADRTPDAFAETIGAIMDGRSRPRADRPPGGGGGRARLPPRRDPALGSSGPWGRRLPATRSRAGRGRRPRRTGWRSWPRS